MNKIVIIVIVVFLLLFFVVIAAVSSSGSKSNTQSPVDDYLKEQAQEREEYDGGIWLNDTYIYFQGKDVFGYDYSPGVNMSLQAAIKYADNDPLIKSFTILNDGRVFFKFIGKEKIEDAKGCGGGCEVDGTGWYVNMKR